MAVVPIVGISTYGSLALCVVEFWRYVILCASDATVFMNGCFEEAELLIPFQRITYEIVN